MQTQPEEDSYFEDYLEYTGWGLYSKFLIGVASACHFTNGVTFVTIVYAAALSTCDQNPISEANALRIYTCYLIGSGIGGLITNSLSDRYGRKRYLVYSLICMFFASFVGAFAYNGLFVIGATLILGVGLETNFTQMGLLLVEVLGKERRGLYVTFSYAFWALGCLITAFFVILFETPTFLNTEVQPNPQLTTWRIMFAICGGAHLVMACVCALVEESPRYYLYADKTYLAFLIVKQLFAINYSSYAEYFKVKEDDLRNVIKHYDLRYVEPEQYWTVLKKLCGRFKKSCRLMCSKGFCRSIWILILIKTTLIAIGLLQLNLTMAKRLTDTQASYKYRALDFIYPVYKPLSYMSKQERNESSTICETNAYNSLFYKYYLVLGLAVIPGQCLGVFIVDRFGRKFVLFTGLVLASCSYLTLGFVEQKWIQFAATCFTMASIGGVMSTITLVNLESYPTAIRGTANAVTSFPGYLVAAFFVNLIAIDRQIFTIILGILYFCLSVLACFLPDLKGKPMVE